MRFFFSVALLLLFLPTFSWAADRQLELENIRKQRAELGQIRKQLEAQLGELGRELKTSDNALVTARAEARRASADVHRADRKLADLRQQKTDLQQRIARLKEHMQQEVGLAYRQANQPAMWLDMLVDAQVADIPHRQFLLARLMQRQQQDRIEFSKNIKALRDTQRALKTQRIALLDLRRIKTEQQHGLQRARDGKKLLWRKVKRDASLKKQRDKQLAKQETALRQLIKGIGSTLRSSDNASEWQSMRKQKGRLPWPLQGRIVANFHSRPAPGRPKLAGVQLAPRQNGGQVKAIASGQVRYANWFGGYGLMMIVDHGDGLMTVYAHNDALYKQAGDWVAERDVLADAGSTGWVRDARLYFEVRDAGKAVNPRRWCRKKS
ncbi:MAG: peptidoglycan DD-metalloendopeptidase family protein [Mariprofundaceae bacterium]